MPQFPKLNASKNPNSFFSPAAALRFRSRFSSSVADKGFRRCLCPQPVMDYGPPHSNHPKPKYSASKQKHVRFKTCHMSAKNRDSSDTLSLSSSSSSEEEFFEVNPQILPKIRAHDKPHLSNRGAKLEVYENEEIKVSSEAMSSGYISQSSDITHESLMPQFSPTQYPPLQLMDKNREFDLNRIPDSVFSKSSTPTEWSAASNDSLFSIRIGESSFSGDHVSKIDQDLPKAGESNSRELSGELIWLGPMAPTFKGVEPYFDIEKSINGDVKPEKIRMVAEAINGGLEKDPIIRVLRDSYVGDRHYNQSEICVQPFVKPIKKKSSSCSLCHCHNCCWSLFFCKCLGWPSCSFKWCVWPSCFKTCSSCHCKCPNFPSLCFKGSSWSCCKCTYWSCCKCSSWSCCKCSSWSCCKCASWSCCKCTSWSCCKCSSWSCFNCSYWPSCEYRCSICAWACCCCWNRERKKFSCSAPIILTDG